MAAKKSQKALLQKLEEYGDSLLEEENQTNKKKKTQKTQLQNTEIEPQLVKSEEQNLHVTPVKNKKKLNKRQRKLLKKQQNGDIEKSSHKTPMSKKMKWLKEALGSYGTYDIQPSKKNTTDENVEDQKSLKRKREPEVIVFEDPTRKKRAVKEAETSQSDSSRDFDMKTARFEVRKLGISGFAGEKKTDARVSLLINLGAKPPHKKSYTNYKEFQRQRKNDLDVEKQKRQEEQVPGEKVAKKKPKKGSRTKNDIGGVDGQIGRYKDGVQYISKETLKRLKKTHPS